MGERETDNTDRDSLKEEINSTQKHLEKSKESGRRTRGSNKTKGKQKETHGRGTHGQEQLQKTLELLGWKGEQKEKQENSRSSNESRIGTLETETHRECVATETKSWEEAPTCTVTFGLCGIVMSQKTRAPMKNTTTLKRTAIRKMQQRERLFLVSSSGPSSSKIVPGAQARL
jgi:hypothetical protein